MTDQKLDQAISKIVNVIANSATEGGKYVIIIVNAPAKSPSFGECLFEFLTEAVKVAPTVLVGVGLLMLGARISEASKNLQAGTLNLREGFVEGSQVLNVGSKNIRSGLVGHCPFWRLQKVEPAEEVDV